MQQTNQRSEDSSLQTAPHTHTTHLRMHLASRWTALLGILASGILYLFLPERFIIGPSWLLLVIEVVLMLPFVISLLTQHYLPHLAIRTLALILLGIITLTLAIGIALLVSQLTNEKGQVLLRAAVLLWVFNILVFALWYFELDGGGPLKRHLAGYKAADFLFPQQASETPHELWIPKFLDYVFLAFTTSTALSPTDTFPLTRRAKGLMMVEAVFSLVIIVLLAARAVNILGS